MAMPMPAGESSDEDDFDDFGYYSKTCDKSSKNEVTNCIPIIDKESEKLDNLYYSLVSGDLEHIRSCLDDGFDVNTKLKDKSTLLIIAASVGNYEITEFLLQRGADPNMDNDGYTPLMAACNCPSSTSPFETILNIVTKLVEFKADVNAINRKRITPFMFAASAGNLEVIKFLSPLVDKEAVDNQGWNGLFWAVNGNHPEVVKFLLDAGNNPHKTDVRCNTPLCYASFNDFDEVIAVLPPKKTTKDIFMIQEQIYDLDEIFQSIDEYKRPLFSRDVWCMLFGMRCENLKEFDNIDLYTFLTLTEKDLKKRGVPLPYLRHRILKGLHRYHKESFKVASIPFVKQFDQFSTLSVVKSYLTAMRHFIVMEASLKYLEINTACLENNSTASEKLKEIKDKLKKLDVIISKGIVRTKQWDKENDPADLITRKSKRRRNKWLKWIPICGIASLILVVHMRTK